MNAWSNTVESQRIILNEYIDIYKERKKGRSSYRRLSEYGRYLELLRAGSVIALSLEAGPSRKWSDGDGSKSFP